MKNILQVATLLCTVAAITDAKTLEDKFIKVTLGMLDTFNNHCKLFAPFYADAQKNEVKPDTVFIWLYHDGNFTKFPVVNASSQILAHPKYNVAAKTMIYSHGFNSPKGPVSAIVARMGAKLNTLGYNLLTFDTRTHLMNLNYFYTSGLVSHVGDQLYRFMDDMRLGGMSMSTLYLAGHSLGAQISGYVAKKYKTTTGSTLTRITGLDPASPCFYDFYLGPEHANHVDVIFTSTMSITQRRVGHAQFFSNNRWGNQPGCPDNPYDGIDCAHSRSIELFVESVENGGAFIAKKCASIATNDCNLLDWTNLGFSTNLNASGDYFLKTNDKSPYDKGLFGLF